MSKVAQTPMLKQYNEIKEQYQDCLLFFRLGDFYEMFGEDALTGSRELEIVLTSREGGNGTKIPMCGIPYHAMEGYVSRLIDNGYKVAICEQTEDPKEAKGIVKRGVVRVITPGTIVENSMLDQSRHNYLAALYRDKKADKKAPIGLAYTDISTGEFAACELAGDSVLEKMADELARINPAECIFSEALAAEPVIDLLIGNKYIASKSLLADEAYIKNNAEELIKIHFKTASTEGLGLKELPSAKIAVAMILDFLQRTQKRDMDYLDALDIYTTESFMLLDANTRRNLELTETIRSQKRYGSLLWVCDDTKTAAGARLLKDWLQKPLLDDMMINKRLDAIEEFTQKPLVKEELRELLRRTQDVERLISRISYGVASPRDFVALKNTIALLPALFRQLSALDSELFKVFFNHFDTLDDLYELLDKSLIEEPPVSVREGGFIREGYNSQVDELRSIATGGKSTLAALEQKERERTGIKSLKVGFNKVFGYYIEVTKSNLDSVPADYIRKQTLVNGERYITEELKEWENKILNASERLSAIEYELFCEIRSIANAAAPRIRIVAEMLAHIDVIQSLAQIAQENNYCRPVVNNGSVISIEAGRHPSVEKIIGRENYVANDTLLDRETQQQIILTGPNMTGKSTYMRQVALITLLARIGSFVPAKSALIGKVDRIFTRVGASDDLAAGQSTFMVEMSETSNILRHATADSLIIFDEIGRGTSTFDGLAIAWAVAEQVMQPECGAKTLFATHYHELTALADQYDLIKNYSIAVKEKGGTIIFLRKIIPGAADRSYGIQVAQLAGLPKAVIARARNILAHLEKDSRHATRDINWDGFTQLSLFEQAKTELNPIIEEIINLNANNMAPIEALMKIIHWQQQLREEENND